LKKCSGFAEKKGSQIPTDLLYCFLELMTITAWRITTVAEHIAWNIRGRHSGVIFQSILSKLPVCNDSTSCF
jgi:hypothetical protein